MNELWMNDGGGMNERARYTCSFVLRDYHGMLRNSKPKTRTAQCAGRRWYYIILQWNIKHTLFLYTSQCYVFWVQWPYEYNIIYNTTNYVWNIGIYFWPILKREITLPPYGLAPTTAIIINMYHNINIKIIIFGYKQFRRAYKD